MQQQKKASRHSTAVKYIYMHLYMHSEQYYLRTYLFIIFATSRMFIYPNTLSCYKF